MGPIKASIQITKFPRIRHNCLSGRVCVCVRVYAYVYVYEYEYECEGAFYDGSEQCIQHNQ